MSENIIPQPEDNAPAEVDEVEELVEDLEVHSADISDPGADTARLRDQHLQPVLGHLLETMSSAKNAPDPGESPQGNIEELIDELELHSIGLDQGTGDTDTCNVCSTL